MECQQLRIDRIPLSQITVGGYQRNVIPSRVARIVNKFDPAMLGLLIVNHRTNGTYAIIDGQHRLAALRQMNVNDTMCGVLDGLTVRQEADYFRFQNENTRQLNTLDMYNAGIYAEDKHYLAIDFILRKYGYHVSRSSGPRCITSIGALTKIAQTFGFPVLQQTIEWVSVTWPEDTTVVRREMLAGIAEFACRFGHRIPTEVFAERMSSSQPGSLLFEYRRRTENRGTRQNAFNPTMRFTMCGVLVEKFNKGLGSSSKYRLKLDWDMPRERVEEVVSDEQ